MARPKKEFSQQDLNEIKRMSGLGIPQEDIAFIKGIKSPKTLRKHCKHELRLGIVTANVAAVNTLYKMATSGKCSAATIFWCKTRCGFREVNRVEVTDKTVNKTINVKMLPIDPIEASKFYQNIMKGNNNVS